LALFDPKYSGELYGVPQRGEYDPAFAPEAMAIVAIGDNRLREKVAGKTKHRFAKVSHPGSIVSAAAFVDEGSMILHGAIIQPETRIGKHVIVNTGARIDHECAIGDFAHIAPGATLCGRVQVGKGALVGAGAVVLPGVRIGEWAVVGAGAVVTKNVGANCTVAGNPARELGT
jgi:sugar O-acyltransferase (sialic acid O-acetyltransferase NeuD family)